MLVDSHCHLDRLDLSSHGGSLTHALNHAKSNGVKAFLCIATDRNNSITVKKIAEQYDEVHCTVGLHPLNKEFDTLGLVEFLEREIEHSKVVGIGETGLDGYYAPESIDDQRKSFELHLEVAAKHDYPLVIHTREAREQTLQLIKKYPRERAGVLHCFTEDWPMAKQAIDLGYYVSISGIVTFKQAENVRQMAKEIPLDRLLVETDSPYLAPVPHRGKSCEPAFTRNTAEFLADLRGESIEQLAEQTTANFYSLFHRANKC